MNQQNLKSEILKYLNEIYNGSYRFIKEKLFIKKFGINSYNELIKNTKFLENTKYAFSVRVRSFIEDIKENPKCIVCGKNTIFNSNNGWQASCSRSCHMKSPDRLDKLKRTNLQKYGNTNFLASDVGKQKAKQTFILKYGVDNYAKSSEYKQRILNGDISKGSNSELISKRLRENYYNSLVCGDIVEPLFKLDEYEGWANPKKIYNWKCKKCGFLYEACVRFNKHIQCENCKPIGSKMEVCIKNLLNEYNIKYIYRDRSLFNGYEIDIYIPSHKLGIELHGLYWHTEKHKKNDLHKMKADMAENNGIKLLQIFEDEFNSKHNIVISRLKNHLKLNTNKLYARNCTVKTVSNLDKKLFLEENHIQGNSNTSINYGLYYNDKLVSVMTFGKINSSRGKLTNNTDNIYELNRFCSLLNSTVIGAAGKLLNKFKSEYNAKKLISYADRRWSNGDLYEKLNFKFLHNTTPNYWYTKDFRKREHRYNYRYNLLSEKLEIFNEEKTEFENMTDNGYCRIWDAGSKKYELQLQ